VRWQLAAVWLFMALILLRAQPAEAQHGLIRRALHFFPQVRPDQVIVLENPSDLMGYLLAWHYSRDVACGTIKEIASFAEFTVDRHFPIFVNASSRHVKRIVTSWERSGFPDQAARVMASDLYHEYQHAQGGADECRALTAQIALLKQWRDAHLLTIAGPYISAKEAESRRFCGR
jgi:hypothetical protein